jgi:hypothetical protein
MNVEPLKYFMKCKSKRVLQMIIGFTAYALGLVAMNYFDVRHPQHRYWLVLLPVVPTIYLVTVIFRSVSTLDEMKRKIVVEAMAFAGLATGFTCFSYLFVRDVGAPEFRAQWALYILWAWYWVGLFFSWRRYR